MFPVMLDVARLPVVVVGNGPATVRRLALLDAGGAARLTVFADDPIPDLTAAAGTRLKRDRPTAADLKGPAAIFIVDLPEDRARGLATIARAGGALVNVEDNIPLCDFHTPSLVRRGDLVLAVSTAGKSPALCRRLRLHLERLFPPQWAERLEALAEARRRWRADGADPAAVIRRTNEMIDREDWLS